ncbi:MAG: hypothetical protein P4L66_15035 [Acetobacteraceae bacterium]|nr:hypothetical protein [Acetobacteraceae bacterium]
MMPRQPSAKSISLIERFEIGDPDDYVSHPVWPGGASGLTVGIGYDLGYSSPAQIGQDWSILPAQTIARLQFCAGKAGSNAQQLVSRVADINVPFDAARSVFEARDIPRTCMLTEGAFLNTDKISADSFGALVSLIFNRGAGMTDTTPGDRLEMRQIRDAMQSGDFAQVPGFIRAMKRLWVGRGLDGLLARRDAEADLFQAGLTSQLPGET